MSASDKLADKQQLAVFQCVCRNLPYKCHKDFHSSVSSALTCLLCRVSAVRLLSSNTYFSLFGHKLSWEIKFSKINISFVPFVFAVI